MPSSTPPWPPLDEDANVVWPDDPDERAGMARRLFGRALVQVVDNSINQAIDRVTNPLPAKPYEHENYISGLDQAYRGCFASMNDKQREITLHMVRNELDGVIISALTSLDQFLYADVKIGLISKASDGQPIEIPITSADAELARQYIECMNEFGQHAAQLVEDLKLPPRW